MATTVAQLAEGYLQHLALAGRSERTLAHYRRALEDMLGFCLERHGIGPDAPAERLTKEVIGAHQLDVARRRGRSGGPLSLSSRNLSAAAIRGLLRHGGNRLDLALPVPDTVVVARVGDRSIRRMELADFDRLVEAVPVGPNALRDRALIEVLYSTGCRLSELCSLTRRRVDLRTREVEVIGKGKKARGTYLTEEAARHLERYLASRRDDSPYLFVSRQGVRTARDPKTGERRPKKGVFPLAPRSVQALVARLALRAGLPEDFSPHWFRHGRLTAIARHSGLLAAQEIAGHASPQTTRRYTRITSKELKRHFDEAERLEREARS